MSAKVSQSSLSLFIPPDKKIPAIFIPIFFFILFDCIGLALNFVVTRHQDNNLQNIDVANRQLMLAERINKANAILQEAVSGSIQQQKALKELRDSVNLFDKTLFAFWEGGVTQAADGHEIFLPASNNTNARVILAEAVGMWKFLKRHISRLPDAKKYAQNDLLYANAILVRYIPKLQELMNNFTQELIRGAKSYSNFLRLLQTIVFALAFINFIIVCRRLFTDINDNRQNSESLAEIINSINTSLVLYNRHGRILSTNQATRDLFGYSDIPLEKRNISHLIVQDENGSTGIRRDGSSFKVRVNCKDIVLNNRRMSVTTITDITQQKNKEAQLKKLAFHDPLTGLPNRSLFKERLKYEILHAKRHATSLAVLFMDLDGFKDVNDRLGHDAGDQLLIQVGERLKQSCREDDTVARLGGDEFTILLTAIRSINAAERIAQKIIKNINQDFLIYDVKVKIGISIGISFFP